MQCYCVASKKAVRHEKTEPKTAIAIVCGFEVSVHVLTFILIRQYMIIINLSESNQEFAVFFNLHSKIAYCLLHSTVVTVTLVVPV